MSDPSALLAAFPGLAVVNWVAAGDADRLRARLADHGVRVVAFDGRAARDQASLFAEFTRQDIPGGPVTTWAAFADAVHQRLRPDPAPVALIWSDADAMLGGGLPALVNALDTLTTAARAAYRDGGVLVTFLTGTGPNFAPLPDA